jgi:hypothetical protein
MLRLKSDIESQFNEVVVTGWRDGDVCTTWNVQCDGFDILDEKDLREHKSIWRQAKLTNKMSIHPQNIVTKRDGNGREWHLLVLQLLDENGEVSDSNPRMDTMGFVFGYVVTGLIYAFPDKARRDETYEHILREPFTDVERKLIPKPKPPSFNCVICKEVKPGTGTSAEPLADGDCCDECNPKVLAERLKNLNIRNTEIDSLEAKTDEELTECLANPTTTKTQKNKIKKILKSRKEQ